MKSQWRKRNNRNTPPPASRTGLDASTDSIISGSELNVAVRASIGPSVGFATQTMSHGSKPRTKKTAMSKPQTKNQRLAFCDIFERTSALITALSIEVIVSKRTKPKTVSISGKKSIMAREIHLKTIFNCFPRIFFFLFSKIFQWHNGALFGAFFWNFFPKILSKLFCRACRFRGASIQLLCGSDREYH